MIATSLFLVLSMANGAPAPAAQPNAVGNDLQLRVLNLEYRVRALTTEVAAARAEAKAAHEAALDIDRYHNGIGLGVLMPKGAGSSQFGMNANLHWRTAQWIPAAGIGFGLAPTIEFYQRVRLRVFDLGVFYNYKNPLTVPDINRKLDLTFASGLDVRIWKGVALHGQVGWFIPNPVSLYDAGKAKYDAAQKANSPTNSNDPLGTLNHAQSSVDNAKGAGQYALDTLKRAFKAPMITLALDLQF